MVKKNSIFFLKKKISIFFTVMTKYPHSSFTLMCKMTHKLENLYLFFLILDSNDIKDKQLSLCEFHLNKNKACTQKKNMRLWISSRAWIKNPIVVA